MIGEILCGLYGLYCFTFCSAVIYTEIKEHIESRIKTREGIKAEYIELQRKHVSDRQIEMLDETEFENYSTLHKFETINMKLDTIYESE